MAPRWCSESTTCRPAGWEWRWPSCRPVPVSVCGNELISRAAGAGVGFRVLGAAGGDRVVVEGLVDLSVAEVTERWRGRLPSLLDELAPATAP